CRRRRTAGGPWRAGSTAAPRPGPPAATCTSTSTTTPAAPPCGTRSRSPASPTAGPWTSPGRVPRSLPAVAAPPDRIAVLPAGSPGYLAGAVEAGGGAVVDPADAAALVWGDPDDPGGLGRVL